MGVGGDDDAFAPDDADAVVFVRCRNISASTCSVRRWCFDWWVDFGVAVDAASRLRFILCFLLTWLFSFLFSFFFLPILG